MFSQRQATTLAQKKRAEALTAWSFMAPAMTIFLVFLIIPIGFALYFSLTNWDGIRPLDQEEQPATGFVVFTNETENEIVIPAGTTVIGGRLQQFQSVAAEPIQTNQLELTEEQLAEIEAAQLEENTLTLPPGGDVLVEVPVEPVVAQGRVSVARSDITDLCIRQRETGPNCLPVENLVLTNPDEVEEQGIAVLVNEGEEEFIFNPAAPGSYLRVTVLNPVNYITTEEVVVPAGVGNIVEAPIRATEKFLGREGNIAGGYIIEVEDEFADQVSVINNRALSNGVNPAFEFIGLNNYRTLLIDDGIRRQDFFTALKNTSYFVMGVVPAQTILALLLAVILNQSFLRGRGFFRTAFYFPSITSSVVISIIFMWMFTRSGLVNTIFGLDINWLNDSRGVFHNFLSSIGIGQDDLGSWTNNEFAGLTLWNWLSGPSVTLSTIMILNTWTTIGTMMVIYLAALQNIPTHVIEAAQVDGATRWQVFRHITVPLVAPTTFFVVTLGLIGTFQVFDQVYVISSGGPAKTTLTIAYIVYQNGFNNSAMGLASATALILFVIIFAVTLVQRRITPEAVAD